MGDLSHVQREKEKILSLIGSAGPSFPSKISRETGIQPLFAAAFMAELLSDRKLKVTAMKVGSSPIYYIQGQETHLEKFSEYLSQKEREAFFLLQSSQILEDEKQEPAIRVALRKLKDFATPINVKIDNEAKLFWKYYLVPDSDLSDKIEKLVSPPKQKQEKILEKSPQKTQVKEEPVEKEVKKTKKPKKQESSSFIDKVKSYLTEKELELTSEILSKKKEYHAKVQHESKLGKQEHLVIAKDKKTLKTEDFLTAIQKAQAEKMPALFLAPGSPDKIASEYLKDWRNLLKFEQI